MKRALILLLILSAEAGLALELIPTRSVYMERFKPPNGPTDIIFINSNEWSLYAAESGTLFSYRDGRRSALYSSDSVKGGMCFVKAGDGYYFCDTERGVLILLDERFRVVRELKSAGAKMDATDIVCAGAATCYIADNDNHRVLRYSPKEGVLGESIGRAGSDRGLFRYPFALATDKDNVLYVSDVLNARVQIFSPLGISTYQIGDWGVEPGNMYRPKGIAVIADKYLAVADGYLGVIQIYDIYGAFVGVLSDGKGKPRKYASPTRIRSYGKRLAVIDFYDNILEVLEVYLP